MKAGALYLVATPIGNLDDITLRAVNVLRDVDLIAAEDTRRTKTLLLRHKIETPLTSYHEHNEKAKAPQLVRRLREGGSVAVVSDAGTPGVSDPAYRLVKLAVAEGIETVPVPGASSVLAALTVSGLPTDRFVFEGFLPWKRGARQTRLRALSAEPRTVVFFESPQRVVRLLTELDEVWGERSVAVARELTKRFEEILRGTLREVSQELESRGSVKGEFVVVVEGATRRRRTAGAGEGGIA